MRVSPDDYKAAGRRFASGVTIITVAHDGEVHGMTASSFTTVSLDPPLVLASLERDSKTRKMIIGAEAFAVNILSREQEDIARSFSKAGVKSFEGIPHHMGPSGAPFLEGALASLACCTKEVVEAGDHDLFIAEVACVEVHDGEPLLYYDRDYRSIG
jgi:flavin reductase (DIM6/NTAB) family NADH-FMN oxidoreductase RutF